MDVVVFFWNICYQLRCRRQCRWDSRSYANKLLFHRLLRFFCFLFFFHQAFLRDFSLRLTICWTLKQCTALAIWIKLSYTLKVKIWYEPLYFVTVKQVKCFYGSLVTTRLWVCVCVYFSFFSWIRCVNPHNAQNAVAILINVNSGA